MNTTSVTEIITTRVDMPYEPCSLCGCPVVNFKDLSNGAIIGGTEWEAACNGCDNTEGASGPGGTDSGTIKRECVLAWNKANKLENLVEAIDGKIRALNLEREEILEIIKNRAKGAHAVN